MGKVTEGRKQPNGHPDSRVGHFAPWVPLSLFNSPFFAIILSGGWFQPSSIRITQVHITDGALRQMRNRLPSHQIAALLQTPVNST